MGNVESQITVRSADAEDNLKSLRSFAESPSCSIGEQMKMKTEERLLAPSVALIAALTYAGSAIAASCGHVVALENFASTNAPLSGATCNTFLDQSAKTGVSCYWEFPFRDDAAVRLASSLWTILQGCRDGIQIAPDLRVNHPDSYYLREWVVGGDTYRVSVKDKGGQKRTLVFFRLE